MRIWRQFREIGIPRCAEYDGECRRLVWPWENWIAQIEMWPEHHACYHGHLVNMLAFIRADGYGGEDMYDTCRFCHRTTDSGFATSHPLPVKTGAT